MNVAFNPSVNFTNTNLISEATRKSLHQKAEVDEKSLQINESFPKSDNKIIQEPASTKVSTDKFEKEYKQSELDEKAEVFAQRLNSKQWKKEYLPENDIIVISQKNVGDGTEYMIKNDGTVMETGLRNKAITIVEPNSQSAKTFAKYKAKLDPNAPKMSLWMMGKEAVADTWKFFTVAGTLTTAAARGLWQGAITGAAVLASAVILRGTSAVIKNEKTFSDIIKHPLKTAGLGGKVFAVIAGGLVLTGHIVAGKLKANQKSAVIEHKIDVPHEND